MWRRRNNSRSSPKPTRNNTTLDLDRQNRFRQLYAATHPGWRGSGQVYETAVRRYVQPDTRVLDVGCGRGGLVELLHDQVDLAAGVDPDQRSLLQHRQRAVRRVCGLAECLPFPDESFDLVICSWVLEHLARPERVFAEVVRVLKSPDPAAGRSGGHFVFLAPNSWHPLTWINRLLGRLGAWQTRLVACVYGRAEKDTFPALYRANTRRRVERLSAAGGLLPTAYYHVGDPTYLAFNKPCYRLAVLVERLTPRWMKVHAVGDFVKGDPYDSSG